MSSPSLPTEASASNNWWLGLLLSLLAVGVMYGVAASQANRPADADELGPARARGVLSQLGGSEGDCSKSAPEGSICGESSLSETQLAEKITALTGQNAKLSQSEATFAKLDTPNQQHEITAAWGFGKWQLIVWPKPHTQKP
jgi:hypothetical protein